MLNLPSSQPPLRHVSSHHDSLDPPDNDLTNTIASVRQYLKNVNKVEQLTTEDLHFKKLFSDIFPSDIPHVNQLPTTVFHQIKLKDPNKMIALHSYECPRKYQQVWHNLLDKHLAARQL